MSEDLDQLLEYWQKALRLQDWTGTAEYANLVEFTDQFAGGDIDHCYQQKGFKIKIVPPDQLAKDCYGEKAAESTIIHELLHLHFQPFMEKEAGPKKDSQELAINKISEALYRLRCELRDPQKPMVPAGWFGPPRDETPPTHIDLGKGVAPR